MRGIRHFGCCSSCSTTTDEDSAVGVDVKVESMESEACELDFNLKLSFMLYKQWFKELKMGNLDSGGKRARNQPMKEKD
ncbi:hypothetical protein J6590_042927 [Homalodisca vitripennis]|nr:hypothetical protein J6590_042927 [Homalodisca vitripennis]